MSTPSTSRQRKIYIAILTIALGGLAVDRLVLEGGATGPSASEASDLAPLATSSTAGSGTAIALSVPVTRTKTLASRLDELAMEKNLDLARVDDAFRPASSWLTTTKAKAQPTAVVNDGVKFAQDHKLLALINNAQGGAAIVNSQTVVLGKVVGGFTLIEVGKRSATFEKNGQRVELKLPAPAGTLTPGD